MFPMNEQVIGINIRKVRQEAKLTLTAVAKKAGLTKSALSKVENGQISAPISTLIRIAQSLNVPIAAFFSEDKKEPAYIFTKKGDGTLVDGFGSVLGYQYQGLALEKKDKLAEPFLLTINPGDPSEEFYHEGQEYIYMLEGIMDFTLGEEVLRLRPGDSLYFDSGIQHKTQIVSKKAVKFLCLFIQEKRR